MHTPDDRITITFNGEIYNYQDLKTELAALGHVFRTASDTEVILAAYSEWGDACLSRLNGMFALAIFDRKRQRLLMARDRAGEKPLFYHLDDHGFSFASELKALMVNHALPKQIDQDALNCYLSLGYIPGERCILKGFRKLPPAHMLTLDLDSWRAELRPYWTLPERDEEASDQEEALLAELESLLQDAVNRQLHADVPVGVLLSGGVDSSLITAMAARSGRRVKTFTVRFPGSGKLDETPHARLIAEHFGTEHIELSAAPETATLLPVLARQYDEPVNDSSMIPSYLVSREIRQHCTVALGGDGGDELFGGYSHYNRLLSLQHRTEALPRCVRGPVAGTLSRLMPTGVKGRNWLRAATCDFRSQLPQIAQYFDFSERQKLLGEATGTPEHYWNTLSAMPGDLLQRATRTDFLSYLPEDILVKVDRASMCHSLEIRAPMLDHRLIEFAYRKVPSLLKATAGSRKVLLKRLAGKILPPAFDLQRKQGFSIPMVSWLKQGPWRDTISDILLTSGQTTFDRHYVMSLLAGQDRGRNNGERLFGLALFELWRQEYAV